MAASGCQDLPKRWVVERIILWLERCIRLAKDGGFPDQLATRGLGLAAIRLSTISFLKR
jgi:transposase